ncbi:MAG: hypothetical protein ABS34_02860 [Opitutaceae bacterium BACL24 MAG-120322-bin51]|jgi:hypothetical protein|nr:MAG: hypothetical protein ABS34_02860 [Opitutaceae bacterium BACL24 MAG-120322-bin51]
MFTFFCLLTIVSFFCYGASCVFSAHMVVEFQRYGLAPFRLLTGYLQILGATGLLLGLLASPAIGLIASIGLSVQMLLGFCVRIRIRDNIGQCLPSFIYMWINAGLALEFLSRYP